MILYRIIKNYLTSVKTIPIYIYLEQELHSDEIPHKACVTLGAMFLK